jgi:hypothetical protein
MLPPVVSISDRPTNSWLTAHLVVAVAAAVVMSGNDPMLASPDLLDPANLKWMVKNILMHRPWVVRAELCSRSVREPVPQIVVLSRQSPLLAWSSD